jgi:hypothetical protein
MHGFAPESQGSQIDSSSSSSAVALPVDGIFFPQRLILRLNNHGDSPSFYRRAGLPTTSRLAESLLGEVNARMKGRNKFWNRSSGAEGSCSCEQRC